MWSTSRRTLPRSGHASLVVVYLCAGLLAHARPLTDSAPHTLFGSEDERRVLAELDLSATEDRPSPLFSTTEVSISGSAAKAQQPAGGHQHQLPLLRWRLRRLLTAWQGPTDAAQRLPQPPGPRPLAPPRLPGRLQLVGQWAQHWAGVLRSAYEDAVRPNPSAVGPSRPWLRYESGEERERGGAPDGALSEQVVTAAAQSSYDAEQFARERVAAWERASMALQIPVDA